MSPRFTDPLLSTTPPAMASCEHCRTVTWAGVPACSCAFGREAVDEEAVARLCLRPSNGTPRPPSPKGP